MWSRLSLVSGPAVQPISIADVKARFGVDAGDWDQRLSGFIAAAVGEIDGPNGIGVALITQTWRLALDAWCSEIVLPLGPVQSVLSVTYVDAAGVTQTLDPSGYGLDLTRRPARLRPAWGAAWPAHRGDPGEIQVTFKAGFGDTAATVPKDLAAALELLVDHFFEDADRKAADLILNRYRVPVIG